jgi:hypothetical protein
MPILAGFSIACLFVVSFDKRGTCTSLMAIVLRIEIGYTSTAIMHPTCISLLRNTYEPVGTSARGL